jgi:metal-responsive CopG/Arc/MetJ family transcriptional regulator
MCIVHCTSMTSGTIVSATTMDMTEKIGITLPKSILQTIDQKRGDIARSRYIRKAIERYLDSSNKDTDSSQKRMK